MADGTTVELTTGDTIAIKEAVEVLRSLQVLMNDPRWHAHIAALTRILEHAKEAHA